MPVITYPFTEPFIDNLAGYIDEHYIKTGRDLSRLAICFGGKRPALFLKRELAKKIHKGFYPPKFFTIDELIAYIVSKAGPYEKAQDLDQCYLLYRLAQGAAPQILKGRETFAQFLPWTREILAFIDQLDLEQVSDEKLQNIGENAEIGYDVPPDINRMLESIVALRNAYHEYMIKEKNYSRGFLYHNAARLVGGQTFEEFDQVLFCNFFYLNRCEETVILDLFKRDKAALIFQGDERKWPVLKRASRVFGTPIVEGDKPRPTGFDLRLYAGFDAHSQVGVVREILKKIQNKDRAVIVLPNADNIIPLLSEIAGDIQDFNISMGYPLKRSSLYSLFEFVFRAQLSRQDDGYYARDYLKALRHPLIKNLNICGDAAVTRVLVHKIEEILTGREKTCLSGRIFIDPDEIADAPEVYDLVLETLQGMHIVSCRADLEKTLKDIHRLVFQQWEALEDFYDFASVLGQFMDALLQNSSLKQYPLNLKIAGKILEIKDEIQGAEFCREKFPREDIYKIFDAKIRREIVAFVGSPLKGLQILGLFETRSLNFDHVIVLDVNEGVLPHLNIYEPLIPREVMISLDLDRLEQEEEIQRYQFMRLISSAQDVHLVYEESRDRGRSRFVEELVWEKEKKMQKLDVVPVVSPSFEVRVPLAVTAFVKTPAMIEALKEHRYSASSINMYLRDPMEFYYNYVLGLQEKEDLLDEPENRQVGAFVHELLEETFRKYEGHKPVIDTAFRNYFQKVLDRKFSETFGKSMKSDAFLLKTVLDARMNRFLDNERENPQRRVAEILFLEKAFTDRIPLSCGEIDFVYKVDRVDRMEDGTVMILDYKTGSVDPLPKEIEHIERMEFSRESIYENVKSFQIPLYFYYLEKYFKGESVNACFYNLRTLELDTFFDTFAAFPGPRHPPRSGGAGKPRPEGRGKIRPLSVNPEQPQGFSPGAVEWVDHKTGYEPARINQVFLRALDFVVSEILNPDVPFATQVVGSPSHRVTRG